MSSMTDDFSVSFLVRPSRLNSLLRSLCTLRVSSNCRVEGCLWTSEKSFSKKLRWRDPDPNRPDFFCCSVYVRWFSLFLCSLSPLCLSSTALPLEWYWPWFSSEASCGCREFWVISTYRDAVEQLLACFGFVFGFRGFVLAHVVGTVLTLLVDSGLLERIGFDLGLVSVVEGRLVVERNVSSGVDHLSADDVSDVKAVFGPFSRQLHAIDAVFLLVESCLDVVGRLLAVFRERFGGGLLGDRAAFIEGLAVVGLFGFVRSAAEAFDVVSLDLAACCVEEVLVVGFEDLSAVARARPLRQRLLDDGGFLRDDRFGADPCHQVLSSGREVLRQNGVDHPATGLAF